MSIKQAIEALEVAQDALDISQSLQESAKSNHHPKTLAAYERVSAAIADLRSMPQGEPVAWAVLNEDGEMTMVFPDRKEAATYCDGDDPVPLYATPHTEAVRMSEAEIDELWKAPMSADWEHREFARAVEQATAARLGVKMGDV